MKRYQWLMIGLIVLSLMLAACGGGTEKPDGGDAAAEPEAAEEAASEPETISMEEMLAGNVFTAKDRNLFFVFEIYGEGQTAVMSITITPEWMRNDTAPGSDENIVSVYHWPDETAFFYVPSEGYGGEFTEFPMFEDVTYQDVGLAAASEIKNVRREKLNGWDVVYGEAVVDGAPMQFWYSEEYGMLMKYTVDNPELGEMYYEVKRIEVLDTVDETLFEKPANINFWDLGESSGFSLEDFMEE